MVSSRPLKTRSSSSIVPRPIVNAIAQAYLGRSDVRMQSNCTIKYNVGCCCCCRCQRTCDGNGASDPLASLACRQRTPGVATSRGVGRPSSSAGRRLVCPSTAWLVLLLSTAFALASCDPVYAAVDGSTYNPEQGSETFKNIAGVGYIILVVFYFFRLLKKRAERATTESLASTAQASKNRAGVGTREGDENDLAGLDGPSSSGSPGSPGSPGLSATTSSRESPADVTVTQCLIGVAQAGTICFGFYLLSRVVDDFFVHQDLPTQYTARNVALLIQSVVRGLVYLVTFIFGANATGLAALAIQMVVDPEGVDRGLDQTPKKKKEPLPKVKVTVRWLPCAAGVLWLTYPSIHPSTHPPISWCQRLLPRAWLLGHRTCISLASPLHLTRTLTLTRTISEVCDGLSRRPSRWDNGRKSDAFPITTNNNKE